MWKYNVKTVIYILTILLIASIVGCKHEIMNVNAENIVIIAQPGNITQDKIIVKNRSEILRIMTEINTAQREIVKFHPDYRLDVHYANSIKKIYIWHNCIKIDGIPYKTNEDLGNMIKQIVDLN